MTKIFLTMIFTLFFILLVALITYCILVYFGDKNKRGSVQPMFMMMRRPEPRGEPCPICVSSGQLDPNCKTCGGKGEI